MIQHKGQPRVSRKRFDKFGERAWQDTEVPLAKIGSVFPNRLKRLRPDFNQCGLLIHPVICRPMRDGSLQLVAGRHRFLAAQQLGWSTIRVRISEMTNSEAELIMIDDNLRAAPLSPAERMLLEQKRMEAAQ